MQSVRIALTALLLSLPAFGAVSFHATATGPNQNGGTITTNLPTVSNNDFVALFLSANQNATSNAAPWTTPSGWTQGVNVGGMGIFYKIWHTGDATTVASTPQNGAGSWLISQTASYSGVDTTTPLDGLANSTYCNWSHGTIVTNYCAAPSLFPGWNNDMLVAAYFDFNAGGTTITLPGALTSRFNANGGPTIRVGDQLLAAATPTGTLNATYSSHTLHGGAQLLLKAASGGSSSAPTPQPTLGGASIDTSAFSDFLNIFPNDGDLLVVAIYHSGTSATISGYTLVYRTTELALFTKTFSAGDSTTFTVSGASASPSQSIFTIRNSQDSTKRPVVDISNTSTASSTTISPPSLSLSGSNDFLMAFYTTPNSGFTWTLPGALTYQESYANNNANAAGTWQGATNPSGTLTGTSSSSGNLEAAAIAFKLPSTVTSRNRKKGIL